jgi:tRNA A37 threonylcarbamoyladenosine synthetase subunit TsaC/SUA5/YrdC
MEDALKDLDVRRTYELIRDGGLALVPTTAGYGLIGMRPAAVARIYALKGRPRSKPCVTVATWRIFDQVTAAVDPGARAWAEQVVQHHPLALITRIDEASAPIRRLAPEVRDQCTKDGTIATFHAAGPLVCGVARLAYADGELVVGSSANRSGTGNTHTVDEVPPEMRAAADLTIDHGCTPLAHLGRVATTILDLTSGRFLREGLHFEAIRGSWESVARDVAA